MTQWVNYDRIWYDRNLVRWTIPLEKKHGYCHKPKVKYNQGVKCLTKHIRQKV